MVGMGVPGEGCHKGVNFVIKATFSWPAERDNSPSQGKTPLCSVLSSSSLKYPRVALRGNADRRAQVTDVEFR